VYYDNVKFHVSLAAGIIRLSKLLVNNHINVRKNPVYTELL